MQRYSQPSAAMPVGGYDGSGEVNPTPMYYPMQPIPGQMPGMLPNTMQGIVYGQSPQSPPPHDLQLDTGLTTDQIENPTSADEAYRGSLKAMLAQNVGHYVVATFLVGTQSPVSWEGFLHSVGNDYLVIFQPDQGRYITGDFYALKFVEFHDQKGVVPSCPGYRRRDGQRMW